MRIAIQPCGDSVAKEHYKDTIGNLVPSEEILAHLTQDQQGLFKSACGDRTAVWGVTEGKRGQNKVKWKKLRFGDVALLYANKQIFSQARIVLCLHNEQLAKSLWSVNAEGKTWEYIYFLDDLQETEIPIKRFNKLLGYKPSNIVQGFTVLEGKKAELVGELLELDDTALPLAGQVEAPHDLINQLTSLQATDQPVSALARAEADILRKYLFGSDTTSECDLCGRKLPTHLIVAAHIKPRASCTEDQRKDLNVVMRACKLGCDDLFERGYITVDDTGTICATTNLDSSPSDLKQFVQSLVGSACKAFSTANIQYFEWRKNHPRRYLR
jgi:hypothetical protein